MGDDTQRPRVGGVHDTTSRDDDAITIARLHLMCCASAGKQVMYNEKRERSMQQRMKGPICVCIYACICMYMHAHI